MWDFWSKLEDRDRAHVFPPFGFIQKNNEHPTHAHKKVAAKIFNPLDNLQTFVHSFQNFFYKLLLNQNVKNNNEVSILFKYF